jgi:hypothetical protein
MKQPFPIIAMLAMMALAAEVEAGTLSTAITLSNLAKGATGVTMTASLTPQTALSSNDKIVITLTGAGLALYGAGTLTFTAPASGTAGTAVLSGAGPFVVTVTLFAGTFNAGHAITFTIAGFTNPTAAQAALTNVAAATTAADGFTLFDVTTSGTYPAILGNLGTASPAITLSNLAKGATGVTMTVSLTPESAVASNGKIIITLAGSGLALTGSASLAFTTPSTGSPAGAAALSGSVLTVTMAAGTFTGGAAITFTIPGFTNPTAAQAAITNVAAATTAADGTLVGLSSVGTYPAILEPPSQGAPTGVSSYNIPPPTTAPSPADYFQRTPLEPNLFRLSFSTRHLCSSSGTMRGCLLNNASFPSGTHSTTSSEPSLTSPFPPLHTCSYFICLSPSPPRYPAAVPPTPGQCHLCHACRVRRAPVESFILPVRRNGHSSQLGFAPAIDLLV